MILLQISIILLEVVLKFLKNGFPVECDKLLAANLKMAKQLSVSQSINLSVY